MDDNFSLKDFDMYQVHHRVPPAPENSLLGHHIISDQISKEGLIVILRELDELINKDIEGSVVEFGCYVGTTSLFIRRILDNHEESEIRSFHVYDSFEGLPQKTKQDNSAAGVDSKAGKLRVSKKEFAHQFKAANLRLPTIHKGWFSQLIDRDIPEKIAFAFLDGDFYDSIISSLRLVWPRMAKGGVIIIDDHKREALPGVDRAIADFFRDKQINNLRSEQNKAIIKL